MTTNFCFDLDGTITTEEVLPVLARLVDLEEEIALLTKATIEGLIPFDKSFRLRCRLLSELAVSRVQDEVRGVVLNRNIVDFINSRSDRCFVVTGNLDCWVDPILDRLNCRAFTSKGLVCDDRLIGVEAVLDKRMAVDEVRKQSTRIISIGDGMGDVGMLEDSDLGIAFGGVHSPVRSLIEVATHVIFSGEALCRFLSRQ